MRDEVVMFLIPVTKKTAKALCMNLHVYMYLYASSFL